MFPQISGQFEAGCSREREIKREREEQKKKIERERERESERREKSERESELHATEEMINLWFAEIGSLST